MNDSDTNGHDTPTDGGFTALAEIIHAIAKGDLAAMDQLYGLAGRPGISPDIEALAESVGLLLVRMEAGDFHLERAAEAEERLKELNQLKNEHLGIAAHDLRNPIGAIRNMSHMIVDMELEEQTKTDFLHAIYRVSEQMLTLVNNLLDIAVIESGKLKLDFAAGNLSALAAERVDIIRPIADAKKLQVDTHLADVPDSLFDASWLGQVIDNLLSNAIKFSEPGSNVAVTSRLLQSNIEITVADKGAGIPEAELGQIFGKFEKLSPRPTAGEKSTGLGLSIAKNAVEAHGGEIRVASEVGVGTVFTVVMPIRTNP